MRPSPLPCLLLVAALLSAAASAQSLKPLAEVLEPATAQAPAVVVAVHDALISSELAALVKQVAVEVGERVERGALLVALDAADYRLALERALAQREAAAARLDLAVQRRARAEELGQGGFASADERLARATEEAQARAELRAAELAVAAARRDLARCEIRAPFDGIVRRRHAQLGSLVGPGSPLLELVADREVEVRAQVQAQDAASLDQARALRLQTASGEWPLELALVSSLVEPGARSREARLRFVGEPLPPGTEGRLLWQRPAGLLPADWVLRRKGQLGVFIAEQGRARFVPLPGAQEGRPVAVDLPASTLLVAVGRDALQDGDPLP